MKTNKERYKQAFSNLQMPKPVDLKEETMNKKTKMILRPAIAFSLAALLLGGSALAYATDAGGIRTKVSGWFGAKNEMSKPSRTETLAMNFMIQKLENILAEVGSIL